MVNGVSGGPKDVGLREIARDRAEKEDLEEKKGRNDLPGPLPNVVPEFFSEIVATNDIDGAGNALVSTPVQFDGVTPLEFESKSSIVFYIHNRDLLDA